MRMGVAGPRRRREFRRPGLRVRSLTDGYGILQHRVTSLLGSYKFRQLQSSGANRAGADNPAGSETAADSRLHGISVFPPLPKALLHFCSATPGSIQVRGPITSVDYAMYLAREERGWQTIETDLTHYKS